MWIHIPWEMPKRYRRQGKAFAKARETFGDVLVQILIKKLQLQPSKGESAKELMIRKMHRPRQAILVLTGHDRAKNGSCRNILQQSCMCVTKPTRNWFQEIFLQAIVGNSFSGSQLLSRLLWVWFCRFVFAFAFSLCPASTNGIVLPSILLLITIVANTSAQFALAKGQELLRFFFDDMG